MLKVLIVDDEYSKAGIISDFSLSINKEIQISHVTTANEARIQIRKVQFDLIVIDINLPNNLGALPKALGGMDLFDLIVLDPLSKIPYDMIFVTEKEDSLESYLIESNMRGTSLCNFQSQSTSWKIFLEGKLKLSIARKKRLLSTNPTVDIAIITALGKPELEAVLNLPYDWENKRFPDDPTGYHFGKKQKGSQVFSIVAASAWRKGMPSSSALAMKMVERFKPKLIVMLGICAGVKEKVNLGDIIVADPSWDWGSGKLSQNDDGSQIFQSAPHQKNLEHHISQLAMEMASDKSLVSEIIHGWGKNVPQRELSVHVGPLASGASVLAADEAMKDIINQNRDLIGVDMEAYAVMAASDYARTNAPISLVIKSVCDFADTTKSNSWQEYASYTSASFFDKLINNDFFPINT